MSNIFIRGNKFVKSDLILLSFLVFLALILRLYKIGSPLADWHSWRQADTSAVTRNYLKTGVIDLLHPKYDDLSNVASGQDNPEGYRFVEFPIYNAVSIGVYKVLERLESLGYLGAGGLEVEIAGRLTSAFSSLASLVFLYFIVKDLSGRLLGFFAAFVFGVLPFSIYYSRVVLPEPMMMAASLGMIYSFIKFLNKGGLRIWSIWVVLGVIFGVVAVLLKPYSIFFFLPVGYLWVNKRGLSMRVMGEVGILGVLILVPFGLWRLWMGQFPEGIPANLWLLNGDGIRFKGAWWFWLFADRIGRLILGYWGLPLLVFGLIARPTKKEGWFYHFWAFSLFLYLSTFATGNVRHDYYQIVLLPILAIFVARGLMVFLKPPAGIHRLMSFLFGFLFLVFCLAFSWYHVRDFYNINRPEIVEAGRAADKLLPEDARVIAPYKGDTSFLYQTKRKGWPVLSEPVKSLIEKGATHFVSIDKERIHPEVFNFVRRIVKESDDYLIFELKRLD